MDKKNTVIGAILIAAGIAFMFWIQQSAPPPRPAAPRPAATAPAATAGASGAAATTATTPAAPVANTAFAATHADSASATVTTLRNSFIEVHFTDFGGAVRDVGFIARDKKQQLIYPAELKGSTPFVFNAEHADPMLAFVDFPGLDRGTRFERVSQTATEVVYRAVLDGRLEVTRRYTLPPDEGDKTDPYQLRHETTIRNLTDKTAAPMKVAFALGTAAPVNAADIGQHLNTGYSTGSDQHFTARRELEASSATFGLFGGHEARPSVTATSPIVWAAVKNQFFAAVLTPDEAGTGLVTRRVKLLPNLPDESANAYGVTGTAQFDVKALAPNAEAKLASNLYVGPKEYARLSKSAVFKADQDKVMEFGFFKFFSQILLTLMTWIHGFVGNWGVAIILTTLTLKIIFVPFTLAASRSAKRMAKLQPELQAMREKYKDNPRKQQEATMELFKTNKVNPVGGCLPILITIPFFMGFFQMLSNVAEFRYAEFLWAADLASADTVGHVFGFPINIMPLLMGATMLVQMRLTPTPSVDNAQAKMMQFMPLIFMFFCYTFSCALSLYSTVNGLFTIVQQLVINKMKDPVPTPAAVAVGPGGKPLKNVTPKK